MHLDGVAVGSGAETAGGSVLVMVDSKIMGGTDTGK